MNELDDTLTRVADIRQRVAERTNGKLGGRLGDDHDAVMDVLAGRPAQCPWHRGGCSNACSRGLVILLATEVRDLRARLSMPLTIPGMTA